MLERDEGGYVRTAADPVRQGPADAGPLLDRAPLSLETSVPGVFAAGDVRAGSAKRMATAVGDGTTAVRMVHDYLREQLASGRASPRAG